MGDMFGEREANDDDDDNRSKKTSNQISGGIFPLRTKTRQFLNFVDLIDRIIAQSLFQAPVELVNWYRFKKDVFKNSFISN